jgi:hypothetical protein
MAAVAALPNQMIGKINQFRIIRLLTGGQSKIVI